MMANASDRGLVLVTGASAGLGEAYARAYARRGRDLVLVARRADKLAALAKELSEAHGIEAFVVVADLSGLDAHLAVVKGVEALGRFVETLVNNAGFGVPQDYLDVPWATQRDFIMTLVVNVCGLTHALLPAMVERGTGEVINTASIAGLAPGAAGHTLYPAAKSFVIKFSQSLDAELRARGVRVTAICPGFTKTDFHKAAGTEALMDQAPRLFWQSAEEVVETAIRANESGRVVVAPGLHNKFAAAMMKYLPEWLTGAMIRSGAEKYRMKKPG
jgi:short-subunit dehydrogenase